MGRPLVRASACMAVVACSAAAFARPAPRRTAAAAHLHALDPDGAPAKAYLAGRQALVGLHAPSTEPVQEDEADRPLLVLRTINRGEALAVRAVGDEGGFAAIDLDRIAHLLRAAGGEEHPIDPRTLALVYRIQRHFEVSEIRVVSGYRVPKASSHSNHGRGRAIDLIVPGEADEDVAAFAREMGFVGVGVYPSSQFVHVDIRPRSYFWVDFTGPHTKNHEHAILADLAAKNDAAALARGLTAIEPFGIGGDVDAALGASATGATSNDADDEDDEDN